MTLEIVEIHISDIIFYSQEIRVYYYAVTEKITTVKQRTLLLSLKINIQNVYSLLIGTAHRRMMSLQATK